MPLAQSSSRDAFVGNLKAELAAGKPRDQALAIAYSVQRRNHAAGGGIGGPKPFHLMPFHGSAAAHLTPMSPSQGTPWWTRSAARQAERPAPGIGHFQDGGGIGAEAPWFERTEARAMYDQPHGGGLIQSSVAGRTDRLPLSVPSESHVVTGDVVSGLGQGNTLAGSRILTQALRTGPYGVPFPHAIHAHTIPHPPTLPHGDTGLAEGGEPHRTSILAAGGEFVIPPHDWVARDEQDGKLYLHRGVQSLGDGDLKQGHDRIDEMMRRVRAHTMAFLRTAPPPKKSLGGAVA